MSNCIGLDVGTYTLVCAKRTAGNEIEYTKDINAFVELPLENRYMFNMLKKSGVPLIEKEKVAFAIGEASLNLAYSMNKIELKRPMQGGCLNPKEKEAFFILGAMLHRIIGEVNVDKAPLAYTVPANAVNAFSDADYHQKILDSIFKKYNVNNKILAPQAVNEALCIVFAELEEKKFTGIGGSFGAGMANICYAMYGTPVFSFSISNSGDWIDEMSAKATNESQIVINREKTKIDLTKSPTNMVERSIMTQYRIMLEKAVAGIKKGIEENHGKFNMDEPVDIVLSGGTSSPNGFEDWFKEILAENQVPMNVGIVRKPKDTLLTVAKGALIAAENSML
jgi:hypothetical protein